MPTMVTRGKRVDFSAQSGTEGESRCGLFAGNQQLQPEQTASAEESQRRDFRSEAPQPTWWESPDEHIRVFNGTLEMLLDNYKAAISEEVVRKILESHNCLSSANFFAMKCSNFTYNVHYYMNTGKFVKALSFLREILKLLIGGQINIRKRGPESRRLVQIANPEFYKINPRLRRTDSEK